MVPTVKRAWKRASVPLNKAFPLLPSTVMYCTYCTAYYE